MKNTFLRILFLLSLSYIQAQQIKVLDKITQKPIEGVAIYNQDKTKSATTDHNGTVSLAQFTNTEMMHFKHLAYDPIVLSKNKILKSRVILIPTAQGLDDIIISASKFQQSQHDVAQKISYLSAEKIALATPQTSADLLQNTGAVFVQKSQLGGGSPMIRGFSTNRLLITVDGVRMNNAIFRGGNLQNIIAIDPFAVEHTEVALGAGSVIYGSDAIGGVMSFYTLRPKLAYGDKPSINANAAARYASANHENTGHFDLNLGFKKWAFASSVSYSRFDDLKMGKHGPDDYLRENYVSRSNNQDNIVKNSDPLLQKNSGYNQLNLMQKIRYQATDNLRFDAGIYYSTTSDIPRYDRLIEQRKGKLHYGQWYYGPQGWFMGNLNIDLKNSNTEWFDELKATFAYQNFKESRIDRKFQSNLRRERNEGVDALSANVDFDKAMGNNIHLFYGFEYVFNKVSSKGMESNIETNVSQPSVSRYPDGATWQSAAAYANLKYKPREDFVIQSGIRYNYIISKAHFMSNNTFLNLPFENSEHRVGALTGTFGVVWDPNDILQWRLNGSSAFRAPNIDDIGKVFDSEPGSVVVPNEGLEPEYTYGGELGAVLNFKNITLDISTYYTHLKNALVRRDFRLNGNTQILYDGELSNVQAIQNASQSKIYGFEIGLRAQLLNDLELTSQYSVVGGKTLSQKGIEEPVRHVAPNFGNTHLVWTWNNLKVDAFLNYNGALSYYQLAPSERKKTNLYASDDQGNPYAPAWHTLNLRTHYQFTKNIGLTASIENISNRRYRPYSSGISAAGRNIILALKATI